MRFVTLCLLLVCSISTLAQEAVIAFLIPEKDLIPEGITYDSNANSFFISSINKRKIVRIDAQQKVSDFISSGQDGVGEALGLKIVNQRLWACSNLDGKSMIHQFDVTSGKLRRKWIFEFTNEKHLFNDLAITANEEAFISDSDYGAIFHVSSNLDKPEVWLKDPLLKDINGIALLNDNFIVVNASIGFFKINLKTRNIIPLRFPTYFPLGIDGLSMYKHSMIGIQNVVFPVSINQYYLNEDLSQIEKARVLISNHPKFDTPTTGIVVGNWFYFISNSQLFNFENGKIKEPLKLKEVLIMKVYLD